MRGILRVITIGFLLIGFLGSAQSAYALVCCGTITCTKSVGGNIVDNYTTTCGCQNDGCPAGYNEESNSCRTDSGTTCGGSGGTICTCGVKADGTCKSCASSSCFDGAVNCPAGTVKGTTVVSTLCSKQSGTFYNICSLGSAQTQTTTCCSGQWKDSDNCWTKPNGTIECEQYYECRGWTINNYNCVPICSAPTWPNPRLLSPSDGSQRSSTTVVLDWRDATFDTDCVGQYRLYVGTMDTATSTIVYGTPTTLDSTTSTSNFVGTAGTTYYWYVQAIAGSNTVTSDVWSFTILDDQITGQVFYDPSNTCGGSGWSSGGVNVSVDGAAGVAVSGTGTYSITAAIGASHTVSINIPDGYACSTGAGCNTCSRSGVGSPSANNNFYLTDSRESWWQAEGAGIYAGGIGGVRSILPSSSLRLILAPVGGTEGVLMTSTGTVDVGSGSVSDAGWRAVSRYRGKKMDFDYFAANMGVVKSGAGDWTLSNAIDLVGYPEGADFGYKNGAASVDDPMSVGATESYVIFVNGNLDINNDITVTPGGFLAFIVKGDVTIDPEVTDLQGLYVIDGSFVTETKYVEGVTDDEQLVTGGSIVAWGSLSLSRSLGAANSSLPAEKFVYRSDLLTNMPDTMKTFVMQWNEVVPGTFNN